MLDGIEESGPSNTASDKPIDPPVAVDDDNGGANIYDTLAPYVTPRGATLTVTAGNGVMANDFDPQGLTMTIASHTNPVNGTLTLNASDGSFTYVPNAGFSGTDTFTYTLTNGIAESDPANVAITVGGRPVVTTGDFFRIPDSGALSVAATGAGSLGSNDSNPDNSAVTYHLDANGAPKHGTVVLNADGSFTYTPNSTFAGIDQFRYYVSDGVSNSNVSPVVIASSGAVQVPVDFSSAETPNPATFDNSLRGLWDSYLASKARLTDLMQSMADQGTKVQQMASGASTNQSDIDAGIAGMEIIFRDYDSYLTQLGATLHAGAAYMRSIYVTTQARADVLNAINALPLHPAGIAPNQSGARSPRSGSFRLCSRRRRDGHAQWNSRQCRVKGT